MTRQPDRFDSPPQFLDAAELHVGRLSALASLLTSEDVPYAFSNLEPIEQAALLGIFEFGLRAAADALSQIARPKGASTYG